MGRDIVNKWRGTKGALWAALSVYKSHPLTSVTLGPGVKKGFMAYGPSLVEDHFLHSNEKSPCFVSHSQLEVSLESLLIRVHWGGYGSLFWEPLYHTMRRMCGAQASTWQSCCAIPEGSAGTLLFVQCLPYRGQKLKISKYSPADIVSQLLQWDC